MFLYLLPFKITACSYNWFVEALSPPTHEVAKTLQIHINFKSETVSASSSHQCVPPPLISSRQLHVYDNHGFVCIFCSILLSRLGYILFSRVHRDMLNFYLFIYTVMPLFFLPYIAGPSAGDVLNISH